MNIETTLIGQSSFIKRLRKEIPRLAKSQSHILLEGERGSGKSLVAQLLHASSASPGFIHTLSPFVPDGSDPKSIERQIAQGVSTILIQEIDEFPLLFQTHIERVVKSLPRKPFVRVIATSKKPLSTLNKNARLAAELFDQFRGFEVVTIPSLSQRVEDIPQLVEYFLRKSCESMGTSIKVMDINVIDFLVRREWKENVRELKSVIENAAYLSKGDVLELPLELVDEGSQLDGMITNIDGRMAFRFDKSLANLEKTLIERALEATSFNQSKAAQILSLSEANLRYRLKKFHIRPARGK